MHIYATIYLVLLASKVTNGWQAKKTHCVSLIMDRAISENEKPPAMRVDIYCAKVWTKKGINDKIIVRD